MDTWRLPLFPFSFLRVDRRFLHLGCTKGRKTRVWLISRTEAYGELLAGAAIPSNSTQRACLICPPPVCIPLQPSNRGGNNPGLAQDLNTSPESFPPTFQPFFNLSNQAIVTLPHHPSRISLYQQCHRDEASAPPPSRLQKQLLMLHLTELQRARVALFLTISPRLPSHVVLPPLHHGVLSLCV